MSNLHDRSSKNDLVMPLRRQTDGGFFVSNGYSNPTPPGGVKIKKRTRFRLAISRILRSGFNVAGLKQTDLDENAESAEIFVLSGILITLLTIAAIWIGLQQFVEAVHQ